MSAKRPEDVHTRRGEPVLVDDLRGYIEFGDEDVGLVSVACEPGGARIILRSGEFVHLRTDPGGERPLRDERGIVWAGDRYRLVSKHIHAAFDWYCKVDPAGDWSTFLDFARDELDPSVRK